jgi:DNA ligase (NAD+)
MNKIKQYLDAASANYYAGRPTMSDDAFDRLAESIGYQEVGAKQHENVKKHFNRMYSLAKHYEDEGARPLADYKEVVSSVKLDGAAISLLYVEGNLVQVLTRGDGIEGTDITAKFIARKDLVPLLVKRMDAHQVIGEIVAPKDIENSRNYAAGALSLKDTAEFCTRAISFFAYGVYPSTMDSYRDDMGELYLEGFETIFSPELDKVYDCDGIVHRVNSNALFTSLGFTAKHPKGAYALKERKEAVETQILGVEWGVGKSGKITPVAILEPVMIGDKCITRATLNNPGFIESLELYIGCTVGLILGGEIIPKVVYRVS